MRVESNERTGSSDFDFGDSSMGFLVSSDVDFGDSSMGFLVSSEGFGVSGTSSSDSTLCWRNTESKGRATLTGFMSR